MVKRLRTTADAAGSVLVCETRVVLHELARFYGPHLHECQLPFNFDLVDWKAAWSAAQLKDAIGAYLRGLPRGAVPTWVLGALMWSTPSRRRLTLLAIGARRQPRQLTGGHAPWR